MAFFIGVDPGASGAIAVLDKEGVVVDLFKTGESETDVERKLSCSSGRDGVFALIERVHSMPKQGVASSFKFGQSYGFLRGILTANLIPFEEVQPAKWQQAMGCRTKGDKNVTKQKAGQLFPTVKVAHWNADALLIAEYCRRVRMGIGIKEKS